MKDDNLPGLSPVWLICLALALGTAIVVLLPASIAGGDAIKASDWIGFAGNVLAGAMTIIAAMVAWLAVQKQISIQQEIAANQAAIERFNILQAQLIVLEDEVRVITRISLEAVWSVTPQSAFFKGPILHIWNVRSAHEEFEKRLSAMSEIEMEFNSVGVKRWAFDGGLETRANVFGGLMDLKILTVESNLILKNILVENGAEHEQLSSESTKLCQAIDHTAARDKVVSVCSTHLVPIRIEIARLSALARTVRKQADL